MKRIFLLLGIAGFTTASAQQKELFDINMHLKKKHAEKSIATPKTKEDLQRANPFQFKSNKKLTTYSFALPTGNKVYRAPAYHMPIIVTDMRQFNKMPNVIIGETIATIFPTRIPNAAPPFTIPQCLNSFFSY